MYIHLKDREGAFRVVFYSAEKLGVKEKGSGNPLIEVPASMFGGIIGGKLNSHVTEEMRTDLLKEVAPHMLANPKDDVLDLLQRTLLQVLKLQHVCNELEKENSELRECVDYHEDLLSSANQRAKYYKEELEKMKAEKELGQSASSQRTGAPENTLFTDTVQREREEMEQNLFRNRKA